MLVINLLSVLSHHFYYEYLSKVLLFVINIIIVIKNWAVIGLQNFPESLNLSHKYYLILKQFSFVEP